MSFDTQGLKSFAKKVADKTESAVSVGAEKTAGFVEKNAPKVADFAKENAPKVKAMAKKGADKAVDFAKKNAPAVKEFAKKAGSELKEAGVEVKDYAQEKYRDYKNRKNITVYTTEDVLNSEETAADAPKTDE